MRERYARTIAASRPGLEPSGFVQGLLGVAVFCGFAAWLYRVAARA